MPTFKVKKLSKARKSVSESRQRYIKDFVNIAKVSKRIFSFAYKTTPGFSAGLLFTIIFIAFIPFAALWINSKIIDELVLLVTSGSANAGFSNILVFSIIALSIIYVINEFMGTVQSYFETRVYFDFSREFSNMVTRKFASLDIEYYEDPSTNDLLQKVKENYSHRPQDFMVMTFWLVQSIVRIISAVLILVYFSPILILFLFLTILPAFVNNLIFGRSRWGIWGAKAEVKRDYWRSQGKLLDEASLMELRVFKAREYLIKRVYNLFYSFQKEQIKVEKKRAYTNVLLDTLSATGFVAVFLKIIFAVLAKTITIGQFSFYIATARTLQGAFGDFFRRITRIYEFGLYVVDIYEVLDMEEKVISGKVILPGEKMPPMVRFNHVSFKYPGTKKNVLKDVYLKIKPGEHLAIVGQNGAGKTTLIKLLMRFYDVTDGEILINGTDLRDLNLESWYDKVGTLFQQFNTYHFDAKTNIGIGNMEQAKDLAKIKSAARKSDAHEFIQRYDNGYDQILSKAFSGGIKPSWGQWQKIALARAFFKDAPILILDEPTSAIDPKSEFEIFERLFDFAQGKTVIIISHRFSTVRNADRIIVLDKGKIIEEGSHDELLEVKGGKYKEAFEMQRKGYE